MATDPTKRILEDVVLGLDAEGWEDHLETSLWYEKGGTSVFTGQNAARGYYLAVRIDSRKDHCTKFMLFAGGKKQLVQPAARFSAKVLASITPDPDLVARLRAAMLDPYNAKKAAAS